MSTSEDNIVLVASLGGGNDVAREPAIAHGIDSDGTLNGVGGSSGNNGRAVLTRDREDGNIGAFRAGTRRAEGTGEVSSGIVVDDGTSSAGSTGKSGLETELASTAGDDGNVSGNTGGVVGLK